MILAGNGVTRRNAVGNPTVDALRRFVERSRIWATHTYMAKGVLDPLGQHSLPPVGLQRVGADLANLKILADADVVIAIGYDLVDSWTVHELSVQIPCYPELSAPTYTGLYLRLGS